MNSNLKDLVSLLKELAESGEIVDMVVATKPSEKDEFEEMKQDAKELAQLNRMLVDAHVEVGFTESQAIKLVASMISKL